MPNAGNAVLKDGGVYTVTPIIGTDGVAAEHVVDAETNKSVGVLNVDINTGMPTITNETTMFKKLPNVLAQWVPWISLQDLVSESCMERPHCAMS